MLNARPGQDLFTEKAQVDRDRMLARRHFESAFYGCGKETRQLRLCFSLSALHRPALTPLLRPNPRRVYIAFGKATVDVYNRIMESNRHKFLDGSIPTLFFLAFHFFFSLSLSMCFTHRRRDCLLTVRRTRLFHQPIESNSGRVGGSVSPISCHFPARQMTTQKARNNQTLPNESQWIHFKLST